MRARAGLLTLLGLAGLGCDGLLEVESPLRVPATALDNPAMAPVLVQSAIGDFECAFGNHVATVANVTDEFYASATTINSGVDLRRPDAVGGGGRCAQVRGTPVTAIYVPLSTARFQADDALSRLQDFPDFPTKTVSMATVAAYAGYAYTLFGESYCEAAFDVGPPLQPPGVLGIAEQRFTTALGLAQAANNAELLNFARVGRARVRLDLGRLSEAAADAKLVTANYVRYATFSSDSPRRQNQVYVWNNTLWATVDPRFRNLTVGGVPDPRVPAVDAGRNGIDGLTRLWLQGKYPTESSSIPIATWEEAQLIVAEAEGGQSAVDRINALRTKVGLPSFASTDSATIVQQVREERRRQLFLQGHRINDMLRFNLPFDTGTNGRNAKNQLYGDLTCFPLPRVEVDNNPNISK